MIKDIEVSKLEKIIIDSKIATFDDSYEHT